MTPLLTLVYHTLADVCKFGAAWLEYISLHDINCKDSLSCVCEGKLGVPTRIGVVAWLPISAGVVDYVCSHVKVHQVLSYVCFLRLQSQLHTPWAAADTSELMRFSDRVLVKLKHVCVLLKRFVGQPKSFANGLTPELHDELLSHFQAQTTPSHITWYGNTNISHSSHMPTAHYAESFSNHWSLGRSLHAFAGGRRD